MNNLQKNLFKEALYYRQKYSKYAKRYGEFDLSTMSFKGKFDVLFDVIVYSGLENEYYKWQEERSKTNA